MRSTRTSLTRFIVALPADPPQTRILLTIAAILLASMIVGCCTAIAARLGGAALGASVMHGSAAVALISGLAAAHLAGGAPTQIWAVNAMSGILAGLAGTLLMRMDGMTWPGAALRGGACFGGAVGFMLAVEAMARLM